MGSGESVVEGNVKVRTEVGWVGWIGEVVVWMVVAMEMIGGDDRWIWGVRRCDVKDKDMKSVVGGFCNGWEVTGDHGRL